MTADNVEIAICSFAFVVMAGRVRGRVLLAGVAQSGKTAFAISAKRGQFTEPSAARGVCELEIDVSAGGRTATLLLIDSPSFCAVGKELPAVSTRLAADLLKDVDYTLLFLDAGRLDTENEGPDMRYIESVVAKQESIHQRSRCGYCVVVNKIDSIVDSGGSDVGHKTARIHQWAERRGWPVHLVSSKTGQGMVAVLIHAAGQIGLIKVTQQAPRPDPVAEAEQPSPTRRVCVLV